MLLNYKNGNCSISTYEDGTMKIECDENIPKIMFPLSMDIKITNYCDMNCPYCHESSTIEGIHGNLDVLYKKLLELPSPIELAIGGGNPLSHPWLLPFLSELKDKGFICNLTVNQGHLKNYESLLYFLLKEKLIYGLGISIVNNNFKYVQKLVEYSDNVVAHLIVGINNINVINELHDIGITNFLALGYKKYGFGEQYSENNIDSLYKNYSEWFYKIKFYLLKYKISFDNLGIEQLNISKYLTKEAWALYYMGDDFTRTMYIDAVEGIYAPTSRSNDRTHWDNSTIQDYFIKNKF